MTTPKLALTGVDGHLTYTRRSVTAWYMLPTVGWAFRGDAEREVLLTAMAAQFAGLAGHRLHLRRTTRPFDATGWGRDLAQDLQRRGITPLPGWSEQVGAAVNGLRRAGHSEGHTMLGVTFTRGRFAEGISNGARALLHRRGGDDERADIGQRVAKFDSALAAHGLGARPATAEEVLWLLYRSVGIGLTPPTDLLPTRFEAGDILALTERVRRYRHRYGSTTCLVDPITEDETHVAVLAVGRMEEMDVPRLHDPWQYLIHRLPFPVEVSSRVAVLPPEVTSPKILLQLQKITHQRQEYTKHEMPAPAHLERAEARAAQIRDDIDTGQPETATQAWGTHLFAVTGSTRRECLQRAEDLRREFYQAARIEICHPGDQSRLLDEFVPGQPDANVGYYRRMPAKLLAAGMPHAAAPVGDGRGDWIGYTATGGQPVMLDLHYPMERPNGRSGVVAVVAEPGAGKSTLVGALAYLNARRGVQVTLLDPSGPLARLADMPELRAHARVLNLRSAQPGILAPYALVPAPTRATCQPGPDGDEEYRQAVGMARAERRAFATDVCSMLLPAALLRDTATVTALRNAVRAVPAEPTSTLDDVVAVLEAAGDGGDVAAKNAANLLTDQRETQAALFFGRPSAGTVDSTAPLMVITMAGLELPDMDVEREYWSLSEQIGLATLHAANRLAVRRCYAAGDMNSRKMVALDEAHFLAALPSGRNLLVRMARDSRKWNLAGLLVSQNPQDIFDINSQIGNLVSLALVGRITKDPAVAAEALRVLNLPTGVGYEETLASLSPDGAPFREFLLRDADGRTARVWVDFSHLPGLMTALNTTPGGAR